MSLTITPSDSARVRVNVPANERLLSTVAGSFAVVWGLSQRSLGGTLAAAVGTGLLYRGASGHCHVYGALGVDRAQRAAAPVALTGRQRAARSLDVLRKVTVQRSAAEVFEAWRRPETLAQAMGHFGAPTVLGGGRTRWTLRDPLGGEHSWETEVEDEDPGKRIRWRTVESAPLLKNVTLELSPAPGERGTEMTLHVRLVPPTGVLGALLDKLFGKSPAWMVERALGNVKSLLEAGELPSLKNNPAAR